MPTHETAPAALARCQGPNGSFRIDTQDISQKAGSTQEKCATSAQESHERLRVEKTKRALIRDFAFETLSLVEHTAGLAKSMLDIDDDAGATRAIAQARLAMIEACRCARELNSGGSR